MPDDLCGHAIRLGASHDKPCDARAGPGVYNQVFGFTRVGGLLLGTIAEYFGAPLAIGFGGVAIGIVVMLVARPLGRVQFTVIDSKVEV